jgi:hypothetical protein
MISLALPNTIGHSTFMHTAGLGAEYTEGPIESVLDCILTRTTVMMLFAIR